MWIIFALSLLIRLAYNLSQPSVPLFACDAFEYLTDAQRLLEFVEKGTGLQTLHGLSIAGPVFPFFILCSYLLFGQLPATNHPLPVLITQSLISALTCVFIAGIAKTCWSRKAGWVAGLIAAAYPAFIINSGRLYSETFAAFLLSGLILIVCKIIAVQPDKLGYQTNLLLCLAAGITAAALQLTRSSMIIVSVVSLLFITICCWHKKANTQASMNSARITEAITKTPLKAPFAFVIGFLLLIVPWLCFSYTAFGKASLILDRAGHYNFFIGNNVDSWGWLPVPAPDLTGIDRANLLQIFRCTTHKNLGLWFNLLLDKPHRLFDFPWNDFRSRLGPINYYLQILFHKILLLSAMFGIGLWLLARQLSSRLFLLVVLGFHFVYLFFITVPRYNLTAMPIVIAFAAAGLVRIAQLLSDKATRKSGAYLATAFAVIITIIVVVPAHGRFLEQRIVLPSQNSTLTTTIRVPATLQGKLQSHTCYLLFDSGGSQQIQRDALIRVNCRRLTGPFVPGLSLVGNLSGFQALDAHQIYLECGYIFNCLTSPSDISNVDLRQWFLVPLPQDVIESAQKQGRIQVEIESSGTAPLQVFAQRAAKGHVLMPSIDKCSWEKAFYGVENNHGFSDPRYSFKLSSQAKDGALVPDILLLVDSSIGTSAKPAPTAAGKTASLITIPVTVKQRTPASLSICSSSVPPYDKSSFWIIRFAGHVKPATSPSTQTQEIIDHATISAAVESQSASLQIANLNIASSEWAGAGHAYSSTKNAQAFVYNTPWIPHSVALGAHTTSFDLAFPIVPSAMPGSVQSIKLSIDSGNTPLELSNCKIEIYDLPCCPLSSPQYVKVPEHMSIVNQ